MTDLEVQAHGTIAADRATAVELDGLTRNYGERAALENVTLALSVGDTLVVFGPNGAGKTTLLRVLATLLRPHEGRVEVLGGRLPDDAWLVRGRVGLLGHEPLLYRELTPRENLRYHASLHGVDEGRVEELLDTVRMAGRADEPVKTLSRGMVQRVAVARATLHDPELLLLDEPYANLDPAAIELVEPLIGGRSDPTHPRTRVLTSHNPGAALAEADIVLGLRSGRVALLADAAGVGPDAVAELYR
jgi:heme exporter protein A